ncbi:putative MFS-type transporter C16A3.17c [Yarrowia sp. B02]|nr:putative MFS-type transporter C16A3.17c [Yarrowia sp. B02]
MTTLNGSEAGSERTAGRQLSPAPSEKGRTALDSMNTATRTTAAASKHNGRPEAFSSTAVEILCVIVLSLAAVLESVSLGALSVALGNVSVDFSIGGGAIVWTQLAFTLATGASLLIWAGIADAFGRKKTLLLGYGLFTISSLVSGFLKNNVAFDVLRGVQGVGTAAAVAAAIGILGSLYPKPSKRKNYAMGCFAAGAPMGFTFGQIIGGICAQFIGWRGIVFFLAMVYGVATILAFFLVPADEPLSLKQAKQKFLDQDHGGALLILSGFVLFVFSMTQAAEAPQQWKTPYIIALIVVGGVLIIAFAVYECYVPKNPIMPPEIWKNAGFPVCMACGALGVSTFLGTDQVFMTQYFQKVKGAGPILTTAYFVPMAVTGFLANVFASMTLHRIPGRFMMIVAQCAFLGASLLMAFAGPNTSFWALPFPSQILSVLGADLVYNVSTLLAINSLGEDEQSRAGGVFNTITMLSAAVALGAATSIVATKTPDESVATKQELSDGYHYAFWFSTACSGAGVILSFFLRLGTTGDEKLEDEESE